MIDEDFLRYLLMADLNVQFKVKTLKLRNLASKQVLILDWLLLKSPNLIDFQIEQFSYVEFESNDEGLEI